MDSTGGGGCQKLLSQMRMGNPNWCAQIATATGCRTVAGNGGHAGLSDGACPEKHGAYGPTDRHCCAGLPFPHGRNHRQGHGRPLCPHGRRTAVGDRHAPATRKKGRHECRFWQKSIAPRKSGKSAASPVQCAAPISAAIFP